MKYGYSTNEEMFSGECMTRQEAVEECILENDYLNEGDTFWTAEQEAIDLQSHIPNAEQILEDLEESIGDEAGEVSEDFLNDVTQEQTNELDQAISFVILGWFKAHDLMPTFWKAKNVEEYTVTKDDIEKAIKTDA